MRPNMSGNYQERFWRELDQFDSKKSLTDYAQKTQLLIIHPTEDEIIGDEGLELYKNLPNTEYREIPGNHSFSNQKDRQLLITTIKQFFKS